MNVCGAEKPARWDSENLFNVVDLPHEIQDKTKRDDSSTKDFLVFF